MIENIMRIVFKSVGYILLVLTVLNLVIDIAGLSYDPHTDIVTPIEQQTRIQGFWASIAFILLSIIVISLNRKPINN